jgi:transglutaminase-like putative cysteine protease
MLVQRSFGVLRHLTLGLSCLCLIEAEVPFLPGLQWCLAPVLLLVLLAYWTEGRWVLPVWGANLLGAFIAAGALVWVVLQLIQSESWVSRVTMPIVMVPQAGPVLLSLLLVKLFRPQGPDDFWSLQGLGLLQVGLGCVLANTPTFGFLLLAYFSAVVACLALHNQLHHEGRGMSHLPGSLTFRPSLLGFTGRWMAIISGLTLLLFLLTPRPDGAAWDPLNRFVLESQPAGPTHIGLSEEIDLTRVGTVQLDEEVAVQVLATDAEGKPKLDLPPDQRWRNIILDHYESGHWRAERPAVGLGWERPPQRILPDFGPQQYVLTFTTRPGQPGGFVLAEPIRFGPPETPLPVVVLPRPMMEGSGPRGDRNPRMFGMRSRSPLFYEFRGTVLPVLFAPTRDVRYRQVVLPPQLPDRTPAEGLTDEYRGVQLRQQPVADLRTWTRDLLRRLANAPNSSLPPRIVSQLALNNPSMPLPREDWGVVARVLTNHLANSAEYTYTLKLNRKDTELDPVLDFLINLKRGHCERYAAALTLMLRSVDIPARVVQGFRGAEPVGEGEYVIRHNQAHSWVEALVPRSNANDFDWLMLDPTPSTPAPEEEEFVLAQWWEDSWQNALQLWRELIVDYNADLQTSLWNRITQGPLPGILMRLGLALLAGLLTLAAVVFLRRSRWVRSVRSVRPANTPPFYTRFLSLFTRYAPLSPRPAQTPLEFSALAREFLQARPTLAGHADLPGRLVELFYRCRFGGQALKEDESRAIEVELDRLADALHKSAR